MIFSGYGSGFAQKSTIQKSQKLQKSVQKGTPKTKKTTAQPRCSGVPLPDIKIDKIVLLPPQNLSRFEWHPGKTYKVYVDISNMGQCETGDFDVKLKVKLAIPKRDIYETRTLGTKTVNSIKPRTTRIGGYTDIWFDYKLGFSDYTVYEFIAVADYADEVEEFDEDNNELYSKQYVVDLRSK
jgi:hypothetical protein